MDLFIIPKWSQFVKITTVAAPALSSAVCNFSSEQWLLQTFAFYLSSVLLFQAIPVNLNSSLSPSSYIKQMKLQQTNKPTRSSPFIKHSHNLWTPYPQKKNVSTPLFLRLVIKMVQIKRFLSALQSSVTILNQFLLIHSLLKHYQS